MASEVEIDIDPQKLILEVKKHPVLYTRVSDYNSGGISYMEHRRKSWKIVCANIVDGWSTISKENRELLGQAISQKWRGIKDTYNKSKRLRSNPSKKKAPKREYVFAHLLGFMDAHSGTNNTNEQTTANESMFIDCEPSNDTDDNLDDESSIQVKNEIHNEEIDSLAESLIIKEQSKPESTQRYEDILRVLLEQTKKSNPIDEDEYFLLSLLPTFRRLEEDQKMEARIEILKVLRSIRQR